MINMSSWEITRVLNSTRSNRKSQMSPFRMKLTWLWKKMQSRRRLPEGPVKMEIWSISTLPAPLTAKNLKAVPVKITTFCLETAISLRIWKPALLGWKQEKPKTSPLHSRKIMTKRLAAKKQSFPLPWTPFMKKSFRNTMTNLWQKSPNSPQPKSMKKTFGTPLWSMHSQTAMIQHALISFRQ